MTEITSDNPVICGDPPHNNHVMEWMDDKHHKQWESIYGARLIRGSQPPGHVTIQSGGRAVTVPETDLQGRTDAEFLGHWVEFANNGFYISWPYWIGKMPTLTSQQAARLMCTLDPDLFDDLNNRPNSNDPTKQCNLARDIELLALAAGMSTATPDAWVAWADANQFKVHWQFRNEADAKSQANTPQAAPAQIADAEPVPVVTHSTKGTRRNVLKPVIEHAQSQCKDPDDIAQVWTQLEKLAGEKYGPLVQMTQGELTYSDGGEVGTIS